MKTKVFIARPPLHVFILHFADVGNNTRVESSTSYNLQKALVSHFNSLQLFGVGGLVLHQEMIGSLAKTRRHISIQGGGTRAQQLFRSCQVAPTGGSSLESVDYPTPFFFLAFRNKVSS